MVEIGHERRIQIFQDVSQGRIKDNLMDLYGPIVKLCLHDSPCVSENGKNAEHLKGIVAYGLRMWRF